MIIGLLIRLIKKVLDLLTALIAWLFVSLGLWVPFVYSLVFVIICAVRGVDLSSVTTLFFFGLFVSLFVSVVLSVYLAGRKFKKKEKRAAVMPSLEKKKHKVTLIKSDEDADRQKDYEGYDDRLNQMEKPKKERKSKKEDKQEEPEEEKKPPINIIEAARADSQRKLIEDGYISEEELEEKKESAKETLFGKKEEETQNDDYKETDILDSEMQAAIEAETHMVVTKGGYNPSEMPRIFATRKDPTVFIYEYSTRLDFYKRTRSGMIYMYSEYKS